MPRKRPRIAERVQSRFERGESIPVDITDHGETYVVAASVPGRRKQDFDISVRKDKLRIVAALDEADTEGRYLKRERESGEVSRVVRLPERIDEKHVSASYENGVLWITLRKRHRPKRVEVS